MMIEREFEPYPTVLSVNEVSKKVGGKCLINRLSLDIRKGEIVGLLGPNGAGKTTLIRMIVGLISMSEGDILIQGKSIRSEFGEAMRHVGAVVENPEFYPYMSGLDNLKQYQRMTPGITEERIRKVVSLVGLENVINQKVKTYSLGMRQRLGIAQALVHEPSLLILDEPTNGLDPAGIREMREYLKQIAREQEIAILVSSHLLSEIELLCSRIVVIQQGELVATRTLEIPHNDFGRVRLKLRLDDAERAQLRLQRMEEVMIVGISAAARELIIGIRERHIPRIVEALASEGIGIYRMEECRQTLEDEFLKWTGGNRIA